MNLYHLYKESVVIEVEPSVSGRLHIENIVPMGSQMAVITLNQHRTTRISICDFSSKVHYQTDV